MKKVRRLIFGGAVEEVEPIRHFKSFAQGATI
jgi:hypothetical protein